MIRNRIREIDVLRGFSSLCMILGHSFIRYPIDISQVVWCRETSHLIYNFHMELFFVVAGVVYYCSDYGEFIAKKAQRLIVPYAFFGVVDVILRHLGGSAVNNTLTFEAGFQKLIFNGGGYWFVYSLFTVFLIYPLIQKLCNKTYKEVIFAVALLIFREIVPLPAIFLIDTTCYYLPYFILGHVAYSVVSDGKLWKNNVFNAVSAVASLGLYAALDMISRSYTIDRKIPDYIRAISIIFFFGIVAHYLIKLSDKYKLFRIIEDFFGLCSRNALQIYLFNSYLLVAVRTIMCVYLKIETPVIIVLILLISNLVLTLTACKWIIPKIPVVRNLCGMGSKENAK